MNTSLRRILIVIFGLAIVAVLVWAFLPKPIEVELVEVRRGSMRVTIDEEGQTRIRERYVIAAPLTGQLQRIEWEPGDVITASSSLIAVIEPVPPSLLDVRAHASAEASVRAAEAALQRAETFYKRAEAVHELAKNELNRVIDASEKNAASAKELDEAATELHIAEQDLRSASFSRDVARFELEQAQSALLSTKPQSNEQTLPDAFEVYAPISGHILRVFQESAVPVQAGTPLVEIGDPADLEVVVDVLSKDGAQIQAGDRVVLEQWGGEPLKGIVRLVEPAGFTKISALGVEEQRVNVIIDLLTLYAQRKSLGDSFRVEARIILWESSDVLKVPSGAVFRLDDQWAVFAVIEDRVQLRKITVGQQNGMEAEVLAGLQAGEQVVLHPGDRVADGVRIETQK